MRRQIFTDWKSLFLSVVVVTVTGSGGLVSAQVCNWGNGTSTPQSVFAQSCHASGGMANGCTCLRNGAGGSSSNYQYWYRRGYSNATAWARQRQLQQQQLQQQQQAVQQHQNELAQQRRDTDMHKRQAEAARKAKFIMDRNAAASTLKGGLGDNGELKGIESLEGKTPGLKGLRSARYRSGPRMVAKSKWSRTAKSDHCPNVYNPMVVNGCGVPSGLPKFVDAAIPHTPSGERVRKGYEAIQSGTPDRWDVALAYFQEAHRLNPHDAGINRLIDLAEYTRKAENRGQGDAAATPAARNRELAHQLDAFALKHAPAQPKPAQMAPSGTKALHASEFRPPLPDRLKGIDRTKVPAPEIQPTPRALWQRLLDFYRPRNQIRKSRAVTAVRG